MPIEIRNADGEVQAEGDTAEEALFILKYLNKADFHIYPVYVDNGTQLTGVHLRPKDRGDDGFGEMEVVELTVVGDESEEPGE